MPPVRRVRSERALVVAAASLGAVAIAVVLTQTAQVVGRDAVRPVGPTPHPARQTAQRAARAGTQQAAGTFPYTGPRLPPPAPGSILPHYQQYQDTIPLQAPNQAGEVNNREPVPAPTFPAAAATAKVASGARAPRSVAAAPTRPAVILATPVPETDSTPNQSQSQAQSLPIVTAGPPATFPPTPSPTPPDRPLGGVEDARMLAAVAPIAGDSARGLLTAPASAVIVITLTPAGTVSNARVERSTGVSALDNAALQAARASSYAPARVDGHPIGGTYRAQYDFTP